MPSCMASPPQTGILKMGIQHGNQSLIPGMRVRWKTSQKQLARDVAGRVRVRPREESPDWETCKRCPDNVPIWECCTLLQASRSIQLHSPARRYIRRRLLHCFALQLHHPVRKFVLRASCKNGTGLTSCLSKRTRERHHLPRPNGEEKPDFFLRPACSAVSSHQLHLLSLWRRGLQRLREGPVERAARQTWVVPGLDQSTSCGTLASLLSVLASEALRPLA